MVNESKVIQFGKPSDKADLYFDIADRRAEGGDLTGALGVMFSALNGCAKKDKADILEEIANLYTDMGLYELANQYWYRYLDCTPKDKSMLPCSEIAINCLIMGDTYSAKSILQKAFTDTKMDTEDWTEEQVVDFVMKETGVVKRKFNIVHPPKSANYHESRNSGRLAMANGRFEECIEEFTSIPDEKRSPEEDGDLAMAYYYIGNKKKAIQCLQDSIEKTGGNLIAYCDLAAIYRDMRDISKANFYYDKVLEFAKDEKADFFKIGMCAVHKCDHERVLEFLPKAEKEYPYNLTVKFFVAVAAMNTGKYDIASEYLEECLKLSREDGMYVFFADFVKKLSAGDKTAQSLIPLKYEKVIPQNLLPKYERLFSAAMWENVSEARKAEAVKIAKTCIYNPDKRLTQFAAGTIITCCKKEEALEFFRNALLSVDVDTAGKVSILYAIVSTENYGKFNIELNRCYHKLNIHKTPFKNSDKVGSKMVDAYAACIVNTFYIADGVTDAEYKVLKMFYDEHPDVLAKDRYTADDIAVAAIIAVLGEGELQTMCGALQTTPVKVYNFLKAIEDDVNKNN